MGVAVAGFDEKKSGKKKNGAETVQRRVQSWKLCDGNQWGKISGNSMRIKNTQSTNGMIATIESSVFSNLRCMKCIATRAAFQTARITSRPTRSIRGKPRYTIATSSMVRA